MALIFFLFGLLFQDKSSVVGRQLLVIFKRPWVIAVSVFVFIFVLAGFFGVNPSWSFWSNFERGEGGLQMLYLGIFFLLMVFLFKEEKDWQKMFWFSVIAATLMISYGVFAGLKYFDAEIVVQNIDGIPQKVLTGKGGPFYQAFKGFIGSDFRDEGYRFAGSIGNPAYVSIYLIFALFYGFYLIVSQRKKRIGLIILIAVFLAFFFLSATRGAFIGLIAAILSGFLYLGFSIKFWRKWLLAGIALLLLTVGSLIYFKDAPLIKSLPGSRIFDISFQTENFKNRMVIWQIAVDGFKERPLLGWGPENFSYTFDKYYNPKHYSLTSGFGAWYDRAHNVFLDYLNQAGILGFLSFIGIFIVYYWQFFRFDQQPTTNDQRQLLVVGRRSSVSNTLLFALPVAYLIQGLVLFDILPTYINLFLFLAFANYKLTLKHENMKALKHENTES